MSAKHTPGPWRLCVGMMEGGSRIIDAGKHTHDIAYVPFRASDAGQSEETRDANARLIAAAPSLLEALEVIKTIATPPHHENAFPAIVGIAQAAIAKAKGASHEETDLDGTPFNFTK